MIILGINCYHANSAAALVIDNEVVFAIEEEKLNRIKNSGGFPHLSIVECLKYKNLRLNDIDIIATNSDPKKEILRKIKFTIFNSINIKNLKEKIINVSKKINILSEIKKIKDFGTFNGKIENIEHHLTHIASSYLVSGLNEACGVSIDGSGDFTTTSHALCQNSNISVNNRIYYPHSLGIFYTALTNFLGFDNYGEEYKVMALGAYGNQSYNAKLENFIHFKSDGTFKLNLNFFIHHKNINTFKIDNNKIVINELLEIDKVQDYLGIKKRKKNEDLTKEHFNIARSLQDTFEKAYFEYLNFSYDKYKIPNLCLAGGCAMNSLANGKITQNTKFKNLYIQPAAYDAGGAIGAAMYCATKYGVNFQNKKNKRKIYLGPKYSNEKIERTISDYRGKFKDKKLKIEKFTPDDKTLVKNITNLLINKKIIGIFRDNLEWGARALGNRSIIADPRGKDIKNIINSKIKRRESFRPFAPIILKDHLKDWFDLDREVPSMMEVHKIRLIKKDIVPAVVHEDFTCRLQTVDKDNNEFIYNLLVKFNELTQVPILLNTSFNENEPIVCKPEEAVDTFLRTNMDALIIQDFLITRVT